MTQSDLHVSGHCLASSDVVYEQEDSEEGNNVTDCPDEVKEKLHQAKSEIMFDIPGSMCSVT
ncbi:hypothetical protein DPMN_086123 [Dreissena polymorpha]|uniref:Uncharacterized protein n=1 Tax=Dreissena polymorpha TaxID=45954 RepID=A0A9D3YHA6_DREPO|nr:hypothetical protein DPMN_086123 [Dreissena polymorpha]